MGSFVDFMQIAAGRGLRIVLGAGLIFVAAAIVGGNWSVVLAVVGAIPLIAGLAGVCFFAPLFGYTVTGQRVGTPTH